MYAVAVQEGNLLAPFLCHNRDPRHVFRAINFVAVRRRIGD